MEACSLCFTCAMDPGMDLASITTQGCFDVAMMHGAGTVQVQAPSRPGEPAAFVCLRGVGRCETQAVIRLPAPTTGSRDALLPSGVSCLAQVGQVSALMPGGVCADPQPCAAVPIVAGRGPWVTGLVARTVAAHAAAAGAAGHWERCALFCRAFGAGADLHLARLKTRSSVRLLQDVGELMGTCGTGAAAATTACT